jgi:hypothetical protein
LQGQEHELQQLDVAADDDVVQVGLRSEFLHVFEIDWEGFGLVKRLIAQAEFPLCDLGD